ncbi:MAG: alkaline phosphatase D family protein, partial [Glutamicibacter ardleyensis]
PPFRWDGILGPWFDNNLALLEDTEDGLVISWVTGVVEHQDHLHPRLETVEVAAIEPREG